MEQHLAQRSQDTPEEIHVRELVLSDARIHYKGIIIETEVKSQQNRVESRNRLTHVCQSENNTELTPHVSGERVD